MYEDCSLFSLSVKNLRLILVGMELGKNEKIKFFVLRFAVKMVWAILLIKL